MRICKRTKHPFLFRRCHSKKRGCCEIWKANELTHGDVYNRGPYVKCNGYQMLPPGFCYIIVQRAKQIFEQPFFHKSSTTSLTTLLTRLCPTFINALWSECRWNRLEIIKKLVSLTTFSIFFFLFCIFVCCEFWKKWPQIQFSSTRPQKNLHDRGFVQTSHFFG